MNPTCRHPARRSSRPVFSLLSVLALLAFACFPVVAQGETGIPEYETEVPTIKGHTNPPAVDSNKDEAKSSTAGEQSQGSAGSSEESGLGSASGGASSGKGGNPSTGGSDSTGQPSQGNGPAGGSAGEIANGRPVSTSEDDSSSPLIPILIAIAALAAISIGAVVIRQRRQRSDAGAQVSPKAG